MSCQCDSSDEKQMMLEAWDRQNLIMGVWIRGGTDVIFIEGKDGDPELSNVAVSGAKE